MAARVPRLSTACCAKWPSRAVDSTRLVTLTHYSLTRTSPEANCHFWLIVLEIKSIAYSAALQYREDLLPITTKEHPILKFSENASPIRPIVYSFVS